MAELTADKQTGFPLVTLPGLPFQIGWLPLTWVQLEYFLCETSDRRFDSVWYRGVKDAAGRISTSKITPSDFPNLFVRGLTLQESLAIGRWWSVDRFFVPTVDQWQQVQQAALALPPLSTSHITQELHPRARPIVQYFEKQMAESLADQMLLKEGLRELVIMQEGTTVVGGVGRPNRRVQTFGNERDLVLRLDDGNRSRRREVGLRLFLKI